MPILEWFKMKFQELKEKLGVSHTPKAVSYTHLLISLMLEMDAAHFSILLNSLKREIESNICQKHLLRELDIISRSYFLYTNPMTIEYGYSKSQMCIRDRS